MGRYSLNLRRKYDPDEETGGEIASRGIASAIEQSMRNKELDRAEANDFAAMGATPVGDKPVSRLRRFGRGIRDLLVPNQRPAPDGMMVDDASMELPPPRFTPSREQGPSTSVIGLDAPNTRSWSAGIPMPPKYGQSQPRTMQMSQMPQRPATQPSTRATQPLTRGISSAIDDALPKPYEITGRSGQRFSVDPSREIRAQSAARRGDAQFESDLRTGERTQQAQAATAAQNSEIDRLVSSGMARDRATALVIGNTDIGKPATGPLSVADQIKLINARGAATAANRPPRTPADPSIARSRNASTAATEDQTRADAAYRFVTQAATQFPGVKGMDLARHAAEIAGIDIGKMGLSTSHFTEAVQRYTDRLTSRSPSYATDTPTDTQGGGTGKPIMTQSMYDRGVAAGKSDAEMAAAYTIPPTIRRKR